ncbi:Stp1/IreP family PP2C-type Ser/Thr phosphatase [Dehalococcoidia bacterium]|nr:Stp1/IreP family PP2C-type Ser/Thr phosphatase [Dehalococcoidia bacterium]
MQINIKSATSVGNVRDHNEDDYITLTAHENEIPFDALLVVADGMGGHAAGEVASRLTIEKIVEALSQPDRSLEGNEFGAFLTSMLKDVNSQVWEAGQEPIHRGMGTTCTLAAIRETQLFLSQVGDSRAYLLRAGDLHQLTTDHSWVEEAVAQGMLTPEQARVHPNRNVITRAIGIHPTVEVDTTAMPIQEGDTLLICSDGLNSMIDDDKIKTILKSNQIDEVCQELIKGANDSGGHDNTTVIVAVIE